MRENAILNQISRIIKESVFLIILIIIKIIIENGEVTTDGGKFDVEWTAGILQRIILINVGFTLFRFFNANNSGAGSSNRRNSAIGFLLVYELIMVINIVDFEFSKTYES